jgi:hypothetical protein
MDSRRLQHLNAELFRLSQTLTALESQLRTWSISLRVLSLDVETLRGVTSTLISTEVADRGRLSPFRRSEIPPDPNRRSFPKEPTPPADPA